jgi:hypothetical protein
MPVQIALTGIVGKTTTPSHLTELALRPMEVKTYVWDPEQKSISFTVLALFPATARWQRMPLPRRGALISIVGEVIGKSEDDDQIAVFLQSLDFISVRGTETATEASMNDKGQSSPQTPRGSRWGSWQFTSPTVRSSQATTGKKRAIDVVNSEEDSQNITPPSKYRRSDPVSAGSPSN